MENKNMKYIITFKGEENNATALYRNNKLVMFEEKEKENAEIVADALSGSLMAVVPFGDEWISESDFEEIQYTELMDIFSEDEE